MTKIARQRATWAAFTAALSNAAAHVARLLTALSWALFAVF